MRSQGRLSHHSSLMPVAIGASLFFVALAVAGLVAPGAWALLGIDSVLSIITVMAYASDKRAAKSGRWRTEESALHAMALFGGWPGALFAQRAYRHKTRKQPFQTMFWFTVIGNLLLATAFLMISNTAVAPG